MSKLVSRETFVLMLSAFVLFLPGCSSAGAAYGRELEGTVLVQAVGVDADGEGGVTLTAAGADGEEEAELVSVSAESLEEAFAMLPRAGEKYLSLTNVTHVIVGDGADLPSVLEFVFRDREMSYMASIWAVNGFAGALMEGMEDGGVSRLDLLEESGGRLTVKEALAALLEGGAVKLPVLAQEGDRLRPVGTLCFEVSG